MSSPPSLLDDPAIVRHGSPTRFTVTPAAIPSEAKAEKVASDEEASALEYVADVSGSGVRGILKRPRCFSESHSDYLRMMSSVESTESNVPEESEVGDFGRVERTRTDSSGSKKSVRFNEVVQRQVYRQNSSILGQKSKNQKKAEQKKRKAAARRASEGDVNLMATSASSCDDDYHNNNHDSGLASSMDDEVDDFKKANENKKKAPRKVSEFLEESSSDLIFDLDF